VFNNEKLIKSKVFANYFYHALQTVSRRRQLSCLNNNYHCWINRAEWKKGERLLGSKTYKI